MKLSIDDACYGSFLQRIPDIRVPDVFFTQALMMLQSVYSILREDSELGRTRNIDYIELIRCRMICPDGISVSEFAFDVVVDVKIMDVSVRREFNVRISDDNPRNMNFIRDAARKVHQQIDTQLKRLSGDLVTVGRRVTDPVS